MASDGCFRLGPWVISAGALLGAALLAGRLSGLFREIELASAFGVSAQADAAVLLLSLPDLFVNLLLSGGLSAALVPQLKALPAHSAKLLFRQTALFVILLFAVLGTFVATAPEVWLALLAPGLRHEFLFPPLALVCAAVAIPLTAASGVTMAGLNAQQRFLIAGCGTLFFNIMVLGSLWVGLNGIGEQLVVLGIGIVLGAALRLVAQVVNLPRDWLFGPTWKSAPVEKFMCAFITTATTASLMLLVPVIVRALASIVSPGAISAFNYATKFVELPAGVLVTSIATVALSRLSESYAQGDSTQVDRTFNDGLRKSLSNAIGAGILIAYFSEAFVTLFLGRGAMDSNAIARVVIFTQILMTGLPFLALGSMNIVDLNAQGRPVFVLRTTLGSLFLLPVFALPGMWCESEALLAWAIVGFQVVQAIWLACVNSKANLRARFFCDRGMLVSLVITLGLTFFIILLDLFVRPFFSESPVVRVVLAALGIGVVVVLPQRAFSVGANVFRT